VTPTPNSSRLAARLLGRPVLRLQPDGRLVSLVREGFEGAFEEIFRRYAAALRSYAASIVTAQRADDVTQEAFTKAYLALRGTDKEIQLRPWLYRIVRNTALTDIRDEPRPGVELSGEHTAGLSPDELAEQREEISRLMARLRQLPESQRAAIVMRELEGLSHEQIAASLGLSHGAVRQSIYRARRALRDGVGLMLPMPVLRLLLDEGLTQGASAAAAGGGAGIAIKTGIAALLAAGTVTTGAIIDNELKAPPKADASPSKVKTADARGGAPTERSSDDGSRTLSDDLGDDRGRQGRDGRRGGSDDSRSGPGENSGPGSSDSGSGSSGRSGSDDGLSGGGGSTSSGPGPSASGSSGSGSSGSGSSGPGSGSDDGLLDTSSGSGSSGSGASGSVSSGSGSSGPSPSSGTDSTD
jgi:RNA polymerase sigma factor (sigma-70 family)